MTDQRAAVERERELKFDVPDDWELPDPGRLVTDGSVEHETVRLESEYFDTAGRALLHHRLTLRRRSGDADTGWQLKVPDGDARLEIRLPLGDGARTVPAELRAATLGVRGGAALRPLATLNTERDICRLVDAAGALLAEIVVDSVSATPAGELGTPTRWREVEVELAKGSEKFLARVSKWLTKHGAVPSRSGSKLVRALDVDLRIERDLWTLSGVLAAYLDRQLEELVRGDIALRRGQDAIHATRVATRRYRAVLRVCGPVFDPGRAGRLDAELSRYQMALGEVRDRQMLRARFDRHLAELPEELLVGPVAARLDGLLTDEQAQAEAALAAMMRSRRYFALLTELRAWGQRLPIENDRQADEVRPFLAKAERTVGRRLRKAGDDDERLHRARKAAKRARFVAEMSRPATEGSGKKAAKRNKKIQDRLGERQDAVVAAAFLRRAAELAAGSDGVGFTIGLLYARERAAR